MAETKVPTNPAHVMKDPLEFPPPRGVPLLVLNEGGVTIKSQWYDGAEAWIEHPIVPDSVKKRMQARYEGGKP